MADEPYELPGEIWKDVPGCRNLQASSFARIRSVPYSARGQFFPGIIRKQLTRKDRRPQLHVWEGKRRVTRVVQVLVCSAFHGPRPDGLDVAHYDGDLANNSPDNLRWATRRENMADSVRLGATTHGEKNAHAKLNAADVLAIRLHYAETGEVTAQARKYGVHKVTIGQIVAGKTWKALAAATAADRATAVTDAWQDWYAAQAAAWPVSTPVATPRPTTEGAP